MSDYGESTLHTVNSALIIVGCDLFRAPEILSLGNQEEEQRKIHALLEHNHELHLAHDIFSSALVLFDMFTGLKL